MSQLTASPGRAEQAHLEKLCTSIRGKLQFMDYLVRAAVADVDRFQGESDPGTRIFLRQLIEMHASNLAVECENMRLVGELCHSLEAAANRAPISCGVNTSRSSGRLVGNSTASAGLCKISPWRRALENTLRKIFNSKSSVPVAT